MIELKQVYKQIGKKNIIENMSFTLEDGHILGLVGSNGAGKSTLLRLLSGIYKQDSGEITVDGQSVYDNVAIKETIFFINDETVQFNNYTIPDLKNIYKPYYSNFSEELFQRLIEITALPMDQKMSHFSKGMKRQAILAIGLSCMTKYLFLDEAFDGIDQTMRLTVKRILIDAMLDRNLTVIISSHHLFELNEICDTIMLMHKGNMLCMREVDELRNGMSKVEISTQTTMTETDFKELNILHFKRTGSSIHMVVRNKATEIETLLSHKNLVLESILPLTLDEIFVYEMEAQGYDSKQI